MLFFAIVCRVFTIRVGLAEGKEEAGEEGVDRMID
jgi:hypothetical protein